MIDSQEFHSQSIGRLARDIAADIDSDIESWAASEAATSNTKSGASANWLDNATKWTTTAANLFTQYTQSKTPAVPQGNITPPQTPGWLLPVGIGATALILMLAFNSKKD
ncbi:hypothetical protein [Catalinimonas niigatensis]|uniref:hypothetical protein n=1 Tax=Catalinimonas niigatensis TaxID=1397264 RepID=UPI002665ABA5|nr:hypothetical protein [Catalinimonas niigatensis]WPP48959.1 hypothetical protein PZB72_20030 [Catalinimonas niigatensis]